MLCPTLRLSVTAIPETRAMSSVTRRTLSRDTSRRKKEERRLSSIVAWISTPGYTLLMGVGRRSSRPGALEPRNT